jgi:uncharacterized protein YecE (DUF72 family)
LPETPNVAAPLELRGAKVRCGACSWADRGLVHEGGFYPRRTMTATARLAYYASRLPVAEIGATERFPPTRELARQWADRTPAGFAFDVRGWSLLTGAPTMPDSLFEDLRDEVRPEARDKRRLYPNHLSTGALDECWIRFRHALQPLVDAGRLGTIILTYPSWFTPKDETRAALVDARGRFHDLQVAVQFRSPKWTDGGACEDTLAFLEDTDLGFVCVDGSVGLPPVVAATAATSVVRFLGRRDDPEDPGWPWPYRYGEAELAAFVPHVEELAHSCDEVHLLFANTWQGDAVANALTMIELLEPLSR